jgi:hypothetical protein
VLPGIKQQRVLRFKLELVDLIELRRHSPGSGNDAKVFTSSTTTYPEVANLHFVPDDLVIIRSPIKYFVFCKIERSMRNFQTMASGLPYCRVKECGEFGWVTGLKANCTNRR